MIYPILNALLAASLLAAGQTTPTPGRTEYQFPYNSHASWKISLLDRFKEIVAKRPVEGVHSFAADRGEYFSIYISENKDNSKRWLQQCKVYVVGLDKHKPTKIHQGRFDVVCASWLDQVGDPPRTRTYGQAYIVAPTGKQESVQVLWISGLKQEFVQKELQTICTKFLAANP